jgi:hypothetical protein
MNDTPITDANEKTLLQHSVTCPPPLFATVESRIVRDIERKLTIARETLSAINNAEILRPDIHAEISRTLKQTAP